MTVPKRPGPSGEEIEEFRQVIEHSLDMVVIFDTEGVVQYVNPAFTRVSGYTSEDAIGRPVRNLGPIPATLETELGDAMRNDGRWQGEWETTRKSGEPYWVSTTISLLRAASGRPTHLVAMSQDVTERYALRQELQEREAYFRALVEGAADVIAVVDESGIVKYISPSLTLVAGWSQDEVVGRNMLEFVHPDDRALLAARFRDRVAGERSDHFTEYRSRAKDGSYKFIQSTGRPLANGAGYVIHSRDISDRVRTEEALRRSEANFRTLAESTPAAMFIVQDGRTLYVNSAAEVILGYTRDELLSMNFLDLVYPDFREQVTAYTLARQRGEAAPSRYEAKIVTKSGAERWVMSSAAAIEQDGRPAVIGIAFDITDHKLQERALSESEEKFRTVADTTPVAIFLYEGGRFLFVNSMSETLTGYSREELLAADPWSVLHPESMGLARQRQAERLENLATPARYELKLLRKDGEERWIEYGGNAATIDGREVIMGSAVDITDRVRAEAQLRDSEQRFRTLAELGPAAIFMIEGDRLLYVNAAGEAMTGYTLEELRTIDPWTVLHPDFHQRARERGRARQRGELLASRYEMKIIRKDGEERWIDFSASLTELDGRSVVLGTALDITESRLAEEALHESEERLRWVVSGAPVILWAIDRDGIVTLSEGSALPSIGMSSGEAVGKSVFDLYADRPDVLELHRRALAGESLTSTYAGNRRIFEVKYAPLRDADGNIAGVIGVGVDVTESRQAQEALCESEERYRALYQDNPAMYFTVDAEGTVLSVNQFGAEQLRYAVDDLVGKPVIDLVFEADRGTVQRQLKRCLRNPDQVERFEFRKIRKGGGVVWVREIARTVAGPGGSPMILLVCEDITALKRMEEALQKARDELERKVERQMKHRNPYQLTFRELTVLHLIVGGKSDKEIAAILGISPLTAHKHVSRILKRMKAESRTEAGIRAVRDGLVA